MMSKKLKLSLLSIGLIILIISLVFGYRDIPLVELQEKYAQAPSKFIHIEGMDVHYRDEGNPTDSIPIVLIHGTGSSLHTFNEWTSALTTQYRVIRMDIPAYGLTGPFPDRDYSIDNYTDFLHQFLEALDIHTCVLGGNSLGGGIAWNYTVQHPEKIDKLILIDASGYPTKSESVPLAFKVATIPIIKNIFTFITPKFTAKASVENVYADKTKVTKPLVDRYFELTLREGNRQAFIDRLSTRTESNNFKDIELIQQPTLILWGEKDELIPMESAYRFQEDLPNDTLVILPNIGHVPMEESPNESLRPVLDFLTK